MTLESSQEGKLPALRLCRHRPAASLHRRDAVIMCEGGKEEAENKRMARRPKRMGKSPVESTAGASCAGGVRRRACRRALLCKSFVPVDRQ